jgi:transposase InsO family protein
MQFENIWLAQYPRPMRCMHDQGTEFITADFQHILLMRIGIKDVPTTVCNPQTKAVCKRLHQSVTKTLHIMLSQNPPANIANVGKLVDTAIATSLHAVRSTIHHTLGVWPGGLVFHRDMLLDIPLLTNFQLIHDQRQVIIDENLCRANSKHQHHDYQPGDECLVIHHDPTKLEPCKFGPFTIEHIHINSTVTIHQDVNTTECLSIQHIVPFHR